MQLGIMLTVRFFIGIINLMHILCSFALYIYIYIFFFKLYVCTDKAPKC